MTGNMQLAGQWRRTELGASIKSAGRPRGVRQARFADHAHAIPTDSELRDSIAFMQITRIMKGRRVLCNREKREMCFS